MTSALMDIADTMATDFLDAVRDAEKADMDAIDKLSRDMDLAFHEYTGKERLLASKAEDAVRTLMEIQNLRDVNQIAYDRRIEALREQMKTFRETKTPKLDPQNQYNQALNVVKLA